MTDKLVQAIYSTLTSEVEHDQSGIDGANLVDALFYIGRGLDAVAQAIQNLGNGNAATHMGAIEAMSVKIGESIDSGLSEVAGAIRGHGEG